MKKTLESHADHQLNPAPQTVPCDFESVDMVFVNDAAEFEGKVIKKGVFKALRASDNFAGLRCSDFSLENAVAVGVTPSPVSMLGDNFSMMDDIDNFVKSIESSQSKSS